jgi:hypothetical protein
MLMYPTWVFLLMAFVTPQIVNMAEIRGFHFELVSAILLPVYGAYSLSLALSNLWLWRQEVLFQHKMKAVRAIVKESNRNGHKVFLRTIHSKLCEYEAPDKDGNLVRERKVILFSCRRGMNVINGMEIKILVLPGFPKSGTSLFPWSKNQWLCYCVLFSIESASCSWHVPLWWMRALHDEGRMTIFICAFLTMIICLVAPYFFWRRDSANRINAETMVENAKNNDGYAQILQTIGSRSLVENGDVSRDDYNIGRPLYCASVFGDDATNHKDLAQPLLIASEGSEQC